MSQVFRTIIRGGALIGSAFLVSCAGKSGTLPAAQAPPSAADAGTAARDFQNELRAGYIQATCAGKSSVVHCFSYAVTKKGVQALGLEKRISSTLLRGTDANALPFGYGPSDLQSAYGVVPTGGAGRTVALIESGDAATLEADLAVYRAMYALPPCTTANGCFHKVGETGTSALPSPDPNWGLETSLDVDMVSAVCPHCGILVVEANAATLQDLGASVDTAVRLGTFAVSNSYGGSEFSSEGSYASHYAHAGTAITASSGDNGYSAGTTVPSAYASVVAVGGTSLFTATAPRGWTESVWGGAGSGCSPFIAKPSWQHDGGCSHRMIADVSFDANPATGVAVYDSTPAQGLSGWSVLGGTSVGAPAVAALYALAGSSVSDASSLYAASINDVVGGSNGTCSPAYFCTGIVGYDGPSGNGSPNGSGPFQAAPAGSPTPIPSSIPTSVPSATPTTTPTPTATATPTPKPTGAPTSTPTATPTPKPTATPTPKPTATPTPKPTATPTPKPTATPTPKPTATPTPKPTATPTPSPTATPTPRPRRFRPRSSPTP